MWSTTLVLLEAAVLAMVDIGKDVLDELLNVGIAVAYYYGLLIVNLIRFWYT